MNLYMASGIAKLAADGQRPDAPRSENTRVETESLYKKLKRSDNSNPLVVLWKMRLLGE